MTRFPTVYEAFTDFFLNKFPMPDQLLFRFDNYGSLVSEQEFINPDHPEQGYVRGKATETFSNLVNRIPVVDGMNIFFPSQGAIDDTYYYRLLFPSIPCIPPGTDADTQQAIIQAFGKIKDEAKKIWESITSESLTGLRLQYKPSLAVPESWFDPSRNEHGQATRFRQLMRLSSPPCGGWGRVEH